MTDLLTQLQSAIQSNIPDSQATVQGSGGHFEIKVVTTAFADQGLLQRQRMVYRAIAPFMEGDDAPVHAIDRMVCVER